MATKKRSHLTKKVMVGTVAVGGGSPLSIQSMTTTDTRDVKATARQIRELEKAGCEIVRVAVPDMDAAKALGKIKKQIHLPLVADIHFDYRLALEALRQGVDKLRINPGNIGSRENVALVVKAAKQANVPIRIGVNAGSLKSVHSDKRQAPHSAQWRAQKLVEAALEHVKILESFNFDQTIISLKASDIATTVEAYRLFAAQRDYPLHLGITEAGSVFRGTIKSSVGMGILLYEGVGDTLRVSLTANPVEEVRVAYQIVQSLGLRSTGIDLISCPTCSRCEVDLISIVNELEKKLSPLGYLAQVFARKPLTVAVMGCVVNGPGEARHADIGITGAGNSVLIFIKGEVARRVPTAEADKAFADELERYLQ